MVIIESEGKGMSFSTYFREVRKENRLSQDDLARILHISNTSIRNIETGRTVVPNQDIFYKLVEYLKEDSREIAYRAFFGNETEEFGRQLNEINKRYMAHMWICFAVLQIAPAFNYRNERVMKFDGIYWKSGFPYYRVLVGNYHKEKYLNALKEEDKTEALERAIFSETQFIEGLKDFEHIKEIRFVMDKQDEENAKIFSELKKVRMKNLGKEYDISYVLFCPDRDKYNPDFDKHYVTIRKSKIGI